MAEIEDITIEEARELVSNQSLWPLVRDFLWNFAPSIHGSWIEDKFGSLEGKISKPLSLQTSAPIKKFILDSFHVEPFFHRFPKEDGSRLLLLDGTTLESLAKWLGALACADALRCVTDGAAVRELKAVLPGIYPEVFGYTMYFGGLEVLKFGSLDVEKVGHELLVHNFSSLSAPLIQRLHLKLPKRMSDMEPPNFKTSKLPNLQAATLKLLKLKFPEAYKLCCS